MNRLKEMPTPRFVCFPCARTMRRCAIAVLLLIVTTAVAYACVQKNKPRVSPALPTPAVKTILSAFDKYEVVAMPAAHGLKDLDDLILALIRNPEFPDKVNDIEMECGNSLYQPILDRYIAGENVPFTEVRKVWRNTTQPMCGLSGFVEQFYPLVRAINQKLPPGKRIRVLAGDSPINWDEVKSFQDFLKFADRESSMGSVMEKEVLSRHRKALLLAGAFHLFHGTHSAVSFYERKYPNVTFVLTEIDLFTTDPNVTGALTNWPVPSVANAENTRLGMLDFSHFYPAPWRIDQNCELHTGFPPEMQKPMEKFVDAFLYLGPRDLTLDEQMPADIALDTDYLKVLQSRGPLLVAEKEPSTLQEFNRLIISRAEHPLYSLPQPPDKNSTRGAVQDCLSTHKGQSSTPQ